MADSYRQILGIRFFAGEIDALMRLTAQGGLVVVPSAPVLVDLPGDPAHRAALEGSDLALTDSGFMVLLWRLLRRERLRRISGLKYLRALIDHPEFRTPGATFWIMPSAEDANANLAWLMGEGIDVQSADVHVAPLYAAGALSDPGLLAKIEVRQPRYIIIALGGGVQERLGFYLRQNLGAFSQGIAAEAPLQPYPGTTPTIAAGSASQPYPLASVVRHPPSGPARPAIICTGAAIAFLSGQQANIPPWADRLFLGWFFRTLSNPKRFFPRYWKALRLAPLLWRYGSGSCG